MGAISKQELADALYEYAKARPEGFTAHEFMADFEIDRGRYGKVLRVLRSRLAEDTITLACIPNGPHELWTYRLVAKVDDGMPWVASRLVDTESRLRSMADVTKSLVNASDGRTPDGRKARIINRAVARLVEDLEDLEARS